MSRVKKNSEQQKLLGRYLIEAGFINSEQLQAALVAQQSEKKRIGEILVNQGWVKRQTLEYLVEKVVLPERNSQKNFDVIQNHQIPQQIDAQKQVYVPHQVLEISVLPQKTFRILLYIAVALLCAHLLGQFTEYFLPDYFSRDFLAELFNLNREFNIPTLYATSLLLTSSILLAIIAYAKQVRGDRFVRYWMALSIIFLYLATDEIISLHERTVEPLRSKLNTGGLLYYTWIIPGAIFVLLCLLVFRRFLRNLPSKTRQLILLAGTIFISGALGVEAVGGYYADLHGEQSMVYAMIAGIEEFLEMLGIIVFIYALLSYISSAMKGLNVRFAIVAPERILNTQFIKPLA
ncbi:hypothetical protein IQ230_08520 [Gloeocapsopsis crepidinum LEGE 06123]|uniref:Uncharacterized protein n=1 Tax=Gloeocapsopsis crepidinum LEGE 06123 TaxID=588587 RepID=A0ABR9UQ36_9CHRO|nr:hypothetical protein [Gloeocapsopsis crepidinum]MBE9190402.1 hypothetical protein [Gloeocapsopsis crepidinum LEGE 06123]